MTAQVTSATVHEAPLGLDNPLTMTQKTWVLPLDEEGGVSIPADLMNVMDWEEGTVLAWEVTEEGHISMRAVPTTTETSPNNVVPQDAT